MYPKMVIHPASPLGKREKPTRILKAKVLTEVHIELRNLRLENLDVC